MKKNKNLILLMPAFLLLGTAIGLNIDSLSIMKSSLIGFLAGCVVYFIIIKVKK